MNTQQKKLMAVVAVILFHGAVITVMLAQHGCKSNDTAPSSADAPVAPTPVAPAPLPTPAPITAGDGFSVPTRPQPDAPTAMPAPVPLVEMAEPLFVPAPTPVVTPAPMPAPASAPAPGPVVTYIVAPNENLTKIAIKNGITVDELVAANATKVTKTTLVHPGQTLNIPNHVATTAGGAPVVATADGISSYKVADRDSLGKIATKFHTTVKALKELNGLTSDNIRAGQILKLPAASASVSAVPASSGSSSPVSAATGPTYTVKPGDTIDRIARAVHVSTVELMSLNGLTAETAKNMRAGKVLKLPAGAQAAPAASTVDAMPPPVPVRATTTSPSSSLMPAPAPVTGMPTSGSDAPPMTRVQ